MRKAVSMTLIFCVSLIIFTCGCNENSEPSKTYTWTAKQATEDMPTDMDWGDGFQLLYTTLKDGDTLIIKDTITNISYDPDKDITTVKFEWTEDEITTTINTEFEGNITDSYQTGDEVKITVTIKYVSFTYQNFNFEMEIYEEQWISEDYFKSDIDSGGDGLKPLPNSLIEKV